MILPPDAVTLHYHKFGHGIQSRASNRVACISTAKCVDEAIIVAPPEWFPGPDWLSRGRSIFWYSDQSEPMSFHFKAREGLLDLG